jgi:hypothetical protein
MLSEAKHPRICKIKYGDTSSPSAPQDDSFEAFFVAF